MALAPWPPNLVLVIPDFESCYAFVNLQNEQCARLLLRDLHGRGGIAGMYCWPPGRGIDAAYSRTQGFGECLQHCRRRHQMVTMRPWIHPSHDGAMLLAKPRLVTPGPSLQPGPSVPWQPGPLEMKPSEKPSEKMKPSEDPSDQPSEQMPEEMKPSDKPSAPCSAQPDCVSQPRVFGLGRPRTDEDDDANKHGPDTRSRPKSCLMKPSGKLSEEMKQCEKPSEELSEQPSKNRRKKMKPLRDRYQQQMPDADATTWARRREKREDAIHFVTCSKAYLACCAAGHRWGHQAIGRKILAESPGLKGEGLGSHEVAQSNLP